MNSFDLVLLQTRPSTLREGNQLAKGTPPGWGEVGMCPQLSTTRASFLNPVQQSAPPRTHMPWAPSGEIPPDPTGKGLIAMDGRS